MIGQSLECLRPTAALRDSVIAFEKQMDRDPDAVEIEEVLDLCSVLVELDARVSDQLPPVKALSRTDKPFFRLEEMQEYMNCALTNLQAADGSLTVLDQRIGSLSRSIAI